MTKLATLLFEPDKEAELRELAGADSIDSDENRGFRYLWQQHYNLLRDNPSDRETRRPVLPELSPVSIWPYAVGTLCSLAGIAAFVYTHMADGFLVCMLGLAFSVVMIMDKLGRRAGTKTLNKFIHAINNYGIVCVPQELMDNWARVAGSLGLNEVEIRNPVFLGEERFAFVELVPVIVALESPDVSPEYAEAAQEAIDHKLLELAQKLQERARIEAEDRAIEELRARDAANSRVCGALEALQ